LAVSNNSSQHDLSCSARRPPFQCSTSTLLPRLHSTVAIWDSRAGTSVEIGLRVGRYCKFSATSLYFLRTVSFPPPISHLRGGGSAGASDKGGRDAQVMRNNGGRAWCSLHPSGSLPSFLRCPFPLPLLVIVGNDEPCRRQTASRWQQELRPQLPPFLSHSLSPWVALSPLSANSDVFTESDEQSGN
jgi:hypothetical protein